MTCWQLMAIIGVAGLVIAVLAAKYGPRDRYLSMWAGETFAVFFIGASAVAAAGLVSAIVYGSRASGVRACRHFGEQSGYITKFAVLSPAATGDCLVKAADGRWVSRSNLQDVQIERRK